MNIEELRTYCLSFEGTTEGMKWGHLCFMIEEKIFIIITLDEEQSFCVKCNPENFEELMENEAIIQAPHFAKKQWIKVNSLQAISTLQLQDLITTSRLLVISKLSKKMQEKYSSKKGA